MDDNSYILNIIRSTTSNQYMSNIDIYKNYIFEHSNIKSKIEQIKQLHQQYHNNYPNNRTNAISDYFSFFPQILKQIRDKNHLKPQNISKCIFIHIPKTGGTSFNSLFTKPTFFLETIGYTIDNFYYNSWNYNILYMNFPFFQKQLYKKQNMWKLIPENSCSGNMYQNLNFFLQYHNQQYTHIHLSLYDMVSNSNVVINNIDYFHQNNYKIMTLLRDPISRIKSEYKFFKHYTQNNKNIMHVSYMTSKLIDCNTIQDYIYHYNCHNYQIAYLYGNTWMSNYSINETQLDKLIDMIQNKYIYVGILENMPQTETYFSNLLNMKIKTPHRNKTSEKKNKSNIDTTLTPEDEKYLMEKNKLDYQLYNFAQKYLLTQVS